MNATTEQIAAESNQMRNPTIHNLRALRISAALLLFGQAQITAGTIVNFDALSDGDVVTNQYSGLSFSHTVVLASGAVGGLLNEFEFPPRSDFNVVSDDGGPIGISFTTPVLSFSGYFTYLTQLTLTAFDQNGDPAQQATSLFGNNLALSGESGSSANEFLQVSIAGGISQVTIFGDQAGGSFTLDDLDYTQTVPEPAYTVLFITTLTAIAVAARRRAYNH